MLRAKNRWQAFGVHILISLCLFLILASVIYFWWYPSFLFHYDGGLEGMKLIAGVDFFIGPVLTLCVYRSGKKGLLFDFIFIAIVQACCLVGGMWTVWKTRPIAVIYAAGTFTSANAYSYASHNIDIKKINALVQSRWPVWLGVDLPKGQEEQIRTLWAMAGSNVAYNAENYVPYQKMIPELQSKGLRSADTKRTDMAALKVLEEQNTNVRFFPITTSLVADGLLAVDIKTGEPIAFLGK
jgi:hypothetical protein